MAIKLEVGQKVVLTATPKDANGKPADAEDAVWTIEQGSTAVLALTRDEGNPGVVTVYASGPGAAVVTCEADADLGDGVKKIKAGIGITVVDPQAVTIDITAGEIE